MLVSAKSPAPSGVLRQFGVYSPYATLAKSLLTGPAAATYKSMELTMRKDLFTSVFGLLLLAVAVSPSALAMSAQEANHKATPATSQKPATTAKSKSEKPSATVPDAAKIAPPAAEPTNTKISSAAEDLSLAGTYKIGVGDVLDIRLLNSNTPRSTLFSVLEGGLIDLPVAGGPIAVAGLTVEEIQNRIAAELKRRAVEGARVSVGVRQYASHSVIVTGLVSNPGTKFLRREAVPLYVIMAEAQAHSDAARVAIMHDGSAGTFLDLNDPAALNFLVQPGDTISVTVRPQEFYYIGGHISYSGQKNFQPGITLLQALIAAGGLSRQGTNVVELSREGKDGLLTTTTFKLKEIKAGKVQDPKLEAGDRIEVIR